MRSRYGVLSLTEDPLSVIMWAHYAQDHRGLCVELATRGNQFFGVAHQVRYLHAYPRFRALGAPMSKQYNRIFLTKSPEWRYEHEWRLVTDQGPGNHAFPPETLVRVIFGIRTPDADKMRVRS